MTFYPCRSNTFLTMKHSFLILLLPLAVLHAHAQAPEPATNLLRVGPLLARAPDFSCWIATFGHPSSQAQVPMSTSQKEVRATFTKTKGIYYEEYINPAGKVWKTWRASRIQATIAPEGTVILGSVGDPRLVTDYSKTDFLGTDWISDKNFIGVRQYKGRKCLVFSETAQVMDPSANVLPYARAGDKAAPIRLIEQISTAIIDFETRLPWYVQRGQATYTYEYLRPPAAMLQFPPEVMGAAEKVGIRP